MVCAAFFGAGMLIGNSYSNWQNSPVATSISTHPIGELDFPEVTVCPARGSNTALYHDLVKHDNSSLTKADRQDLIRSVHKIFIEEGLKENMRAMLARTNPENLQEVYRGFHSFPKPYEDLHGFEIKMWKNNGSVHTPWYGQRYNETHFYEDKTYHTVLEFPEDIEERLGNGQLVIELEVDLREEEEGWVEEVVYSKGSRFKLIQEKKNWTEAEAHCESEGSHLASVLSEGEQQDITTLVGKGRSVWLGGRKKQEVWKWTDSSHWGYTKWAKTYGNRGKDRCVRWIDKEWKDESCRKEFPFVCTANTKPLRGAGKVTFEYRKDQLEFFSFQVWYKYKYASQSTLEAWENKRMTGFKLSWYMKNPTLVASTNTVGRSLKVPEHGINQSYKASLEFPENIGWMVGNGSLVIELSVNPTCVESRRTTLEYMKGPKYMYFPERKTWMDANAHCLRHGGQLASVLSEREHQRMNKLVEEELTWIGGQKLKSEEDWHWADNSTWGFNKWRDGKQNIVEDLCAALYQDQGWAKLPCTWPNTFICKTSMNKLDKKDHHTFEFTKEQLNFPGFHVWYSTELDDSQLYNETCLELTWFLKNGRDGQETMKHPGMSEDWAIEGDTPKFVEPGLVDRIQEAKGFQNLTRDDIIAYSEPKKVDKCIMGQRNLNAMPSEELGKLREPEQNLTVSYRDLENGFMMYSAYVHCPEELIKLNRFFEDLVANETARTIIEATVSTIRSDIIEEKSNQRKLFNFFLALDDKVDLKYGNILLATAPRSEIETILKNGWPFFTNITDDVKMCLTFDKGCNKIQQQIADLGKVSLCKT